MESDISKIDDYLFELQGLCTIHLHCITLANSYLL